jgi:hypothetical protein
VPARPPESPAFSHRPIAPESYFSRFRNIWWWIWERTLIICQMTVLFLFFFLAKFCYILCTYLTVVNNLSYVSNNENCTYIYMYTCIFLNFNVIKFYLLMYLTYSSKPHQLNVEPCMYNLYPTCTYLTAVNNLSWMSNNVNCMCPYLFQFNVAKFVQWELHVPVFISMWTKFVQILIKMYLSYNGKLQQLNVKQWQLHVPTCQF